MRKTSHKKEMCPLARSLDVIGEWWTFLIVREAFSGVRRFEDFQTHLGIPRNTLTQRLAKLVEAGVMVKQAVADGGRRQEYVLAPMGAELLPVLVLLREWGMKHCFKAGETPIRLIDERDGTDVHLKTQFVSGKGRPVTTATMRLEVPPVAASKKRTAKA
nr:HxlR-like helix-turn-helix [uncultured organism]